MEINEGEDYFCIDSKQIEVCRLSRSKRCSMGKKDLKKYRQSDTTHHKMCIITDMSFT